MLAQARVREVEDMLQEDQASEDGEEEDDEDETIVYMAVLFDRGQLGFAIYDAATTRLKTLQLAVSKMDDIEEVCDTICGLCGQRSDPLILFRR